MGARTWELLGGSRGFWVSPGKCWRTAEGNRYEEVGTRFWVGPGVQVFRLVTVTLAVIPQGCSRIARGLHRGTGLVPCVRVCVRGWCCVFLLGAIACVCAILWMWDWDGATGKAAQDLPGL